jgi:Na+/H+ antiporter NhaD/arsenite permease-like protein
VQTDLIITVFIIVYAGIALGRIPGLVMDRTGIALLGAIAMLGISGTGLEQAAAMVDMPTLMLLYALMIFSAQLRLGGFYTRLALGLARRLAAPARFLALQMLVSAVLAALLANDIICLAFTPVLAQACLSARISPMPHLLGLAMAANIGSAATLIGNPQNMLIGQVGGLDFGAFLGWSLPPTLIALLGAYGILYWRYRDVLRQRPDITPGGDVLGRDYPPFDRWQSGKGLVLLALLVALFFTPLPRELSALGLAAVLLLSRRFHSRAMLGLVDWHLITLFASLFVVVGIFRQTGAPDALMAWVVAHGGDPGNGVFLTLVAAVLSNLVSNVPATMLLLQFLDPSSHGPWYVLALAATFAGNLLLVGSIANLIVAEQAAAHGIVVRFGEYARVGIPVTLLSLVLVMAWATFGPAV